MYLRHGDFFLIIHDNIISRHCNSGIFLMIHISDLSTNFIQILKINLTSKQYMAIEKKNGNSDMLNSLRCSFEAKW